MLMSKMENISFLMVKNPWTEMKIKFFVHVFVRFLPLFPGDDFSIIQQEIFMVKECMHHNIVAYFGSYLW